MRKFAHCDFGIDAKGRGEGVRLCQVLSGTPYEARSGGGGFRQITRHMPFDMREDMFGGRDRRYFPCSKAVLPKIFLCLNGRKRAAYIRELPQVREQSGFIPLSEGDAFPA